MTQKARISKNNSVRYPNSAIDTKITLGYKFTHAEELRQDGSADQQKAPNARLVPDLILFRPALLRAIHERNFTMHSLMETAAVVSAALTPDAVTGTHDTQVIVSRLRYWAATKVLEPHVLPGAKRKRRYPRSAMCAAAALAALADAGVPGNRHHDIAQQLQLHPL